MNPSLTGKVVLITGAARRIGAVIVRRLHQEGMNIVLHYRTSQADAIKLANELNAQRAQSVHCVQADLLNTAQLPPLIEQAVERWYRLDLLINNASSFYPTPIGTATEQQWDDLVGSNVKAPFFLAQAAAPYLRQEQGSIVNLVDIYAQRPMGRHTIYCIAKAGMAMLTYSLARELGPEVRVNGIAPGAMLWPDAGASAALQNHILSRLVLPRPGDPQDIANAVVFLARDCGYITGQIIAIDGGRLLFM